MTITTEALLLARNALTDAMRAAHNNVMWRPDQSKATQAVLAIGAALAQQPAASGEPAEWQGRVGNRGRWRRIDPPPGETMEQRVAYLRSMPAYEIRALYAAPQPAPAPADPVVPHGFKVESMPPWGALTDEANADRRWMVTRTEPPYCNAKDERHWQGPTMSEALRRAHVAMGMPWAGAQPAPARVPLTDERLNAAGLDYALADSFSGKAEWVAQDIADAFKAGARAAERYYAATPAQGEPK